MNEVKRIVTLNNVNYEVTEDEERYHFKEISNAKNKVHFTFSKDEEKNKEAEYGLRVFWTEVYS